MTTQFDISRLVEVALADERSGVALYGAMADKANGPQLKAVFQYLSAVEKDHAALFEEIIDNLKKDRPKGAYPDDYAEYLDVLCSEGADSNAFQRISTTANDKALLELAIEFEKAQLGIQRDIGEALGGAYKNVIDVVLKEERNHLVSLSRVKQQLAL